MDSKEYYSLLNIDRTASREEIKKAYRKLAMEFHPDVNLDEDAEEKFKAIGEAYSVLCDSGKRRIYDRVGKTGLSDPYAAMVRPAQPCMGKCSGLDALFRRNRDFKRNITPGR
jgi:molecular chaperone DnaJ